MSRSSTIRRGAGRAWIEALFPRSYLDANIRNVTELDVTLLDDA